MAKLYSQKSSFDYEETFSLMAMIKSIKILLSITAYYDYGIWQMDVKFLNGYLEENIYIMQLDCNTQNYIIIVYDMFRV